MQETRDGQPTGTAPVGPDFSGPEDRAAPAPAPPPPATAMPQYTDAAPPAAPEFVTPEPPPVVAAAVAPPVASPLPQRRPSPWPVRITAAVVILSMIAILLAVILPRQRTQMQAHSGGATTETPMPSAPGGEAPGAATGEQGAQADTAATAAAAGWGQDSQGAAGPGVDPAAASPAGPGGAEGAGTGSGPADTGHGEAAGTGPGPAEGMGGTGAGTERCGNCGGTGQVSCPMKHLPNGHLLNPWFWNEPRYYTGDDPLLPDEADLGVCPLCKGTYRATCPGCEGRGEVDPAAALPKGFDPAGVGGFDLSALQDLAGGMMGGQ